jgi:transcriptional regulator with XRE-family HTH domain
MSTATSAWNREPSAAVTAAWAPTTTRPAPVVLPARPAVNDEAVSSLVGRNLKHLRRHHRFSLEELSSLCGVSRAMLGQIEQGKSIPSIKTLWQVAQALGVSVSWFLEASHETNAVRIPVPAESHAVLRPGEGELRSLQQAGDGGIDAFYELRLAPGAALSLPAPPVPHRVHVTVAQGILTVVVDDTPHVVPHREALQYEGRRVLLWRNEAALPVQAYVVVRSLLRGA